MSEPKKPQDHKQKQIEAPPDRVAMVSWEGHDYLIDPASMDDLVFMELLADMEAKPYLVAKVVAHILGADQWARFKVDHADEAGRISGERVGAFFDVMNAALEPLGN